MASVNQNIQKFYDSAQTRDFSRDFLFRVTQINLPGFAASPEQEQTLVYVKGAALPGRNITNIAVPYMGLTLNVPGAATYPGSDSYALKFYLDAESKIRNDFENASRQLFNDDSSTGEYGTPNSDYFVQLAQLDKGLETVAEYKLVGASLRNIDSIDYSIADGTGATVEVNTTIAYHYYTKIK
jgi:hypothetical protein